MEIRRRMHRMPFGAECAEGGGVRFRLWAPAARSVGLKLAGEEQALPMTAWEGGFYELFMPKSGPGTRYRFLIDGELEVPDPASRLQPQDVHGPSEVVDPFLFHWSDQEWRGRPWAETVLYELHVGSFAPEGSYDGVREKLDHLARLGVTAVELMPLAESPGRRGWGYDGVYPFAPEAAYGSPDALKRLVGAAHDRGLMVFLDVVYNHFGPEGNYIHRYAPQFFTERHRTPWGAAINFDGEASRTVRDFFIENALYWTEEYGFDGLRFDAVHAIIDDSPQHILVELAERLQAAATLAGRHLHLVLENDANEARYLERRPDHTHRLYTAQWNDDIHHAWHTLLTGESGGYYEDYAARPLQHLKRCLGEGFAWQGEPSPHRQGARRGEPSAHLPAEAFVSFLQNHDQVGNRAFGERISALVPEAPLRAAVAVQLLAPSPPLLFMGEEWGAPEPFPFFCDFGPELAEAVRSGRRKEFARFPAFADPAALARIPDPVAETTFRSAVLDWRRLEEPAHRDWLELYRKLLALRRREIVPRLVPPAAPPVGEILHETVLNLTWRLGDGCRLTLIANLGAAPRAAAALSLPGRLLHATDEAAAIAERPCELPAWFAAWYLAA